MDDTELLTVTEAARLLRVSRASAYSLAAAGRLPIVKVGPRSIRVSRARLARWIEERSTDGDAA
jgi:excisionase family DNA binding protein